MWGGGLSPKLLNCPKPGRGLPGHTWHREAGSPDSEAVAGIAVSRAHAHKGGQE